MPSKNLFTEEGRTRFRNFWLRLWSYLIIFLILGALAGMFVFLQWTRGGMGALERLYFRQYAKATVVSLALPGRHGKYVLLVSERSGRTIGVTDELVYPVKDEQGRSRRDQYGWLFKAYPGAGIDEPRWRQIRLLNSEMGEWFRQNIYGGESLASLFVPALIVCLIVTMVGTVTAVTVDQRLNRKYEQGMRLRGSRLVEPHLYEREVKGADGLALVVKAIKPENGLRRLARKLTKRSELAWKLRMKRSEEAQGMLILGDIGSGKSQIIHRFLEQLAGRNEAAVVYDPACEFVKAHYNSRRGDVILNPLDARSPFWSQVYEQKYRTDYAVLAESFFPGRRAEKMHQTELFFLNASRDIFARMLEFEPHPSQLVAWLADTKEIDRMVAGTELAHYIDPKAPNQRGGVLGSLSRAGKTLRILPRAEECEFDFSLTEWAEERSGWIFLTSTKETEEQLRPLYAAYLDLLMRRLMSVDEAWGRTRPVKLIVDEVHTLEYLPTLYKAATEGRKFGLHLFQGTQNKHQYDDHYGQAAPTMLSCPRYTIILRCKEPDSAGWLSNLIGEEEIEKPRTGVTASVSDQGRDSINYSSFTERRAVVSREEIAGLPDLAGYWKYGEIVTPFRFDFTPWRKVADGFVPRQSLAAEGKEKKKGGEATTDGKREHACTADGAAITPAW
ncbi:MAG: type IV secretion system DNA-binding domain-containing protein [Acidobacteria bacterium]|nr:type IV secretion system DNA-binding domain-containing protein [Acidobacteriota bacterium]